MRELINICVSVKRKLLTGKNAKSKQIMQNELKNIIKIFEFKMKIHYKEELKRMKYRHLLDFVYLTQNTIEALFSKTNSKL